MNSPKRSGALTLPDESPENLKNAEIQYKDTYYSDKTAIAHLKELYLVESRQRYPNVPEYGRVAPSFKATKTNDLTKAIITFLRLKGAQAERITSEGRIIDQRKTFTDVIGFVRSVGSIKRIPSSSQRGTADISATIAGRSVKIEVKNINTKDRQSHAQVDYQAQVENAGGIYLIASSLPQFVNWYYSKFGR